MKRNLKKKEFPHVIFYKYCPKLSFWDYLMISDYRKAQIDLSLFVFENCMGKKCLQYTLFSIFL